MVNLSLISDVYIEPLEIKDVEIENYLTDYLRNVSETTILTMLSDPKAISDLINYEDLHFLTIHNKNFEKPIGLTILHADKTFLSFKRFIILHFSVITNKEHHLPEFLEKVLDFVWKRDNCEEIRCNLFHSENNGEFEVAEKFKEAFMKNLFRWKSLTNDKYTKKRSTVYGIKRNLDIYPFLYDLYKIFFI